MGRHKQNGMTIYLQYQSAICFQPQDRGPLDGVVISVSKKLGISQTEYHEMVVELGGDYSWQYSKSCTTHFIFQVNVLYFVKCHSHSTSHNHTKLIPL